MGLFASLINVDLSETRHGLDSTLPLIHVFILIIIWLDHAQKVALLVDATCVFRQHSGKVSQQCQLGLCRVDLSVLDHSLKCVTHDGDQHVQHCHLSDECCQNKCPVTHRSLWIASEIVQVKLTEGKLVLIEEHIDSPVTEVILHDLVIVASVEV